MSAGYLHVTCTSRALLTYAPIHYVHVYGVHVHCTHVLRRCSACLLLSPTLILQATQLSLSRCTCGSAGSLYMFTPVLMFTSNIALQGWFSNTQSKLTMNFDGKNKQAKFEKYPIIQKTPHLILKNNLERPTAQVDPRCSVQQRSITSCHVSEPKRRKVHTRICSILQPQQCSRLRVTRMSN